ncbi:hypothetical protein WME73_30975 [Sorangium sp. So ce302]
MTPRRDCPALCAPDEHDVEEHLVADLHPLSVIIASRVGPVKTAAP